MLIVAATAVFAQLQSALNRIWEVTPKKGSFVADFLRKRMLSFALVVGIGFLLLVSLVLSAGLSALQAHFEGRFGSEAAWLGWISNVVSFLLFTLLFAMVFQILPDAKIPWRDVWVGALVTALLFVVGKWAIGLYLGRSAVGSAYGAAGSVLVILLWVYYVSMILLFGAEFTRAFSRRFEKHAVPPKRARRGSRRARTCRRRDLPGARSRTFGSPLRYHRKAADSRRRMEAFHDDPRGPPASPRTRPRRPPGPGTRPPGRRTGWKKR